jgi:hypothetical protein
VELPVRVRRAVAMAAPVALTVLARLYEDECFTESAIGGVIPEQRAAARKVAPPPTRM